MMKILLGYDGSESADAALHDLKRAGLPDEAEALILSVADVMMAPATSNYEIAEQALTSRRVTAGLMLAQKQTARVLSEAKRSQRKPVSGSDHTSQVGTSARKYLRANHRRS